MEINEGFNRMGIEKGPCKSGISQWIVIGVLVITLGLGAWLTTYVEANETVHNKLLKVGLLFNEGSHQEAVPFVTLSAPNGLDIMLPGGNLSTSVKNTFPQEESIFHLDQFYLVVEETLDLQHAITVNASLRTRNYHSLIIEESLLGTSNYQIVIGYNNSFSQMETLAEKIRNETTHYPTIKGNYRVQAGVYSNKEHANEAVNEFRKVGFVTYIATAIQDGNIVHKVLIGNEISEGQRDSLREHLIIAFPDKQFINATSVDHILSKRAYVDGRMVESIAFSMNIEKLIIKAKPVEGVPVIKVNERFNRHYRGSIELSMHNNRLAVINELPMDQYLYGVVPREMASGWPMEALKAQAVIARTFALGRGNNWKIAHVVDDVKDQAYWGYSIEAVDTSKAVDETKGQLLRTSSGGLAQTFYSSNAGGMTAEGTEVWGTNISYIRAVPSTFDAAVLERISKWYRVMLADGTHGYIHSNYLVLTGEYNGIGLEKGRVEGTNVNIRTNADIYHTSVARVNAGDSVVILEEVYENNAYQWSKGPYSPIDIRNMINDNQRSANPVIYNPVLSLEISKSGVSGRVMEVKANGNVVPVSSPDAHRSLFREGSSLRSTKFVIEARGEYSILGASGKQVSYPQTDSLAAIYVVGKTSETSTMNQAVQVNGNSNEFIIMNQHKETRVASKRQEFVFHGNGFGHGFGLSQWGAYGMAIMRDESGNVVYNYKDILHHYYSTDVYLTPIE